MQKIESNNYPIYFKEKSYKIVNNTVEKGNYSILFIIVDKNTHKFCLPIFLSHLSTNLKIEIIEFEAGECNKNIETCIQIWNTLTELGADRKSLVINLGGGVVTDLGGFVASTFKRGIDFINIPTTLLSMVDASIGGKTGIDLGTLKNQIGVINTPKMVLIDSRFLETLSKEEMRSGVAEMIKHGLIYDKNYWEKFLNLKSLDNSALDELIYRSVEIKNEIVMQDPNEKNIRKSLNFGHTLGHAIESYFLENINKKSLLHGEAIAVGMILESFISLEKKLITQEEYKQIKSTIKLIYGVVEFNLKDILAIIKLLIHDKKNEYGNVQFALIEGIGRIKLNQSVENELIKKSFEDYKF